MAIKKGPSRITRRNWGIDALLAASAVLTAITAVYFLYLPDGGYKGGRNPYYGIVIFFTRHTWEDLHLWAGIAMIAVALVHLFYHWSWVVSMTRRAFKELFARDGKMNLRSRLNYLLNAVVVISFALSAISGVYFLFFPGERGAADPLFLFSRLTWDLIHTWAGVVLIAAAVIHFAIHWRWVVNVTGSIARSLVPQRWSGPRQPAATGER